MYEVSIGVIKAAISTGVSDPRKLFILNKVLATRVWQANQRTQARLGMHRRIAECAENGQVAIVSRGRDCDGVCYSGDVRLVDANWRAVIKHIDHDLKWADGPTYHEIERPSTAANIEPISRDLGTEAHENGHAHSLYAEIYDDIPF